jgi:hypothetical protein
LIQPYRHDPPMMCKTMTDRGAHPSRADPGVPTQRKLVYASSSVAQELLSSPSLPQACLSQIPASLYPPNCQLTKVVALPDPRHTLVMPLFRIAVALCGPSIPNHRLSPDISFPVIILPIPPYPPQTPPSTIHRLLPDTLRLRTTRKHHSSR